MCLCSTVAQAQPTRFNEQWIMGSLGYFQMNFKPVRTLDSFKNDNLDNKYFGRHSGICDSNGRLLMVSNGFQLFDSNGNIVQGGGN